jgi:DNA-binding NarL/FixJ family response regulator
MRVAIAEDSVLLREGVAQLLTDAGIEVTARCGTADELLARVAADPPDAVIVDIRMPPTHTDEGMQAALTIRKKYPDIGCSCCPSTSRWDWRCGCWPTQLKGPAIY